MKAAESQAKLQRYRVMEPLGEGGAGRTFRGVDTEVHRDVAIKVLSLKKAGNWKAFDLFEREVAALKSLDHPGIPKYVDSFAAEDTGDFFLVMELVEGRSLAEAIEQQRRFTPADLRSIFEQMLDILGYLHSLSPPVIHRDIKPANIVRDADDRVHLVDFGGVRRAVHDGGGSTMIGTFGYMAPEQLHGAATAASDLYSLAATMVALHAGQEADRLPHDGLRLDVEQLDLPDTLGPVLARMLEPEPKDRLATVQAVRRAYANPTGPRAWAASSPASGDELVKRESTAAVEISRPVAALAHVPAPLSLLVWIFAALGTGVLTVVEVALLPLIGWLFMSMNRRGGTERRERTERGLQDARRDVRRVRRSLSWLATQTHPLQDEDETPKKKPGQ